MASLLKNQILKHISKFSKNLSPDKINLSTLKGEGELCNLELDEKILTQLLDLPTWLQITKASVNRVTVKIQWTRLKSQPIFLMLDKVVVETETCETPRPPNDPAHLASYRSGGKYGFTDRVIDGIYVHVESVEVKLVSKAFHASLQLLRLKVQSTTPTWQPTNDLRQTRLRDTDRDEIILFKEIEWQNVKIEANGIESTTNPDFLSTPLRLLANMSKIRITVKKKLNDCSIVASRVVLLIDDLLWVLTATQLKAAILYSNSLSEVIERSAKQSKNLAAEKLKKQGNTRSQTDISGNKQTAPSSAAVFNKYDVLTTSYHLITSRIDLHLCDDGTAETACPPERTWNIENGALQVTMFKLSVDYYPFHPAGGERKQWFRYTDNIGSRNPWVQQLFSAFRTEAVAARKACGVSSPPMPQHQKSPQRSASPQPTRSPQHMAGSNQPKPPGGSPIHGPGSQYGSSTQLARPKSTRLLESCFVLKLEDFTIYMVSTPQNQRSGHHKFFASDKKQLHLPADMSVLHLEYTEYFFPDELDAPVPHANLYALLNPVRLTFDNVTLLWFNFFMLNLSQSLEYDLEKTKSIEHVDVKFEALMPRVLLPAETKVEGQPDRPEYLQIQISKACISNTRVEEKMKCQDLKNVLESYKDNHLIKSTSFPNDTQFTTLPSIFYDHSLNQDNPYIDKKAKWLVTQGLISDHDPNISADATCLNTNTLKKQAIFDVWGIVLDQVWLEFLGALNSRSRPQPFVEALPVTLWITAAGKQCPNNKSDSTRNTRENVNADDAKGSKENGEENGSRDKRPTRLLLKQFYSKEDCSNSEENCDSNGSGPDSDRQSSKNCDEENLADFYVIAKIGAKLRVQLNHFQYLFILRLSESLLKFVEQLTADFQMLGVEASSSFVFPLAIPQVEVAAQCPCLMNLKCFPDDLSIPVSPSDNTEVPNQETEFSPSEFSNVQFAEVIDDVQEEVIDSKVVIPGEFVPNVVITKSMSDSKIQSHCNHPTIMTSDSSPSHESNLSQQLGMNRNSMSAIALSEGNTEDQDFSVSSNSVGMDSGISMDSRRSAKDSKILKGTEMMKTFSSAFTNWTDKLKVKADGSEDCLSVSTEDLETMSVKTDLSSDDDFEHLINDDAEAPAFCHDVSETASTTDTFSDMADDSSSVYAESSSTRGKEIVSVVLFKLDLVEVIAESTGTSMSVGAQVAKLSTCQPGNINTEDFHAKFSGSKGFVTDDPLPTPVERFPIKFYYYTKTAPQSEKGNNVCMNVQASDISLSFKMSSLTSLADFVEDEKIPDPFPMSIDVRNLLLILEEDRPSSNPASPSGVPMDIQVHRVAIHRGSDGVFHLCGGSMESFQTLLGESNLLSMSGQRHSSDTLRTISVGRASDVDMESSVDVSMSELALQPLRQLQTDNAALKTQINEVQLAHSRCDSQIESLKNENDKLKVQLELLRESKGVNCVELQRENYSLMQRLQTMEEDCENSLQEKKSLLATLRLLQDDLMKSEQRNRSHTTSS